MKIWLLCNYVQCLFCIGFSKTFDVVNQRILLNKPEHCVIRCQAHASFEKILSIKQMVKHR